MNAAQPVGAKRSGSLSWKFWLGIAISLVLLYFTFKDTSLTKIWTALRAAHYVWMLPIIGVNFMALFVRAYRWRFFFAPNTRLRYYSLLSATVIGFFANNVLPARMGEFVRAYLLSKRENISGSLAFGTIVIERVFDFITMLMIFGGFAAYKSVFPGTDTFVFPAAVVTAGWLTLAFSICVLGVLVLLRFRQTFVIGVLSRLMKPFSEKLRDRVVGMFRSFAQGLFIFESRRRIVITFLLSFVIWFGFIISCECMFRAFDLVVPLSGAILLIIFLTFAVSVPSAPGFIGTFHYAADMALKLLGIQTSTEAFSVLLHAVSFIPVTLFGFIFLLIENVSFSEMRKSAGALGGGREE